MNIIDVTQNLSKEASSVFFDLKNQLLSNVVGMNEDVANTNALVFAMHADIVASMLNKSEYSALNYYKEKFELNTDKQLMGNFYQINSDVDINQQVNVIDITNSLPEGIMLNKDIKTFVAQLAKKSEKIVTADNKSVIGILKKDIKHITYSSNNHYRKKDLKIRQQAIFSIEELIKKAVLIESIPNIKQEKKPNIKTYHRFYVPVRVKNDIKVIRLVAEEAKGTNTIKLAEVNLYDLIIEKENHKKRTITQTGISPAEALDGSYTISIREMLENVKDFYGKPYISKERFNQFAGENSLTHNKALLIKAKQMYEEGKLDIKIWKETGWKRGKDGKWRYEIPDNVKSISFEKLREMVRSQKAIELSSIYKNDLLYKAYPSLKQIKVFTANLDTFNLGQVVTRYYKFGSVLNKFINLNRNRILCTTLNGMDGEEAKKMLQKTVIHEIQHLIQDIEHFAGGGNLESKNEMMGKLKLQYNGIRKDVIDKYKNLYKKLDDTIDLDAWNEAIFEYDSFYEEHSREINIIEQYEKFSTFTEQEFYENLGGEQEAREVAERAMRPSNDMPIIHDNNAFVYFGEDEIEKFNSDLLIKGNISVLDNEKRVVSIYENADCSTFIHEMGHMFLMDLKDLSKIDEKSLKDLQIVNNWAKWEKNKGYNEFIGTPWENEFKHRHEEIMQAEQNCNYIVANKLKEEWIHEKFARSFELYIKDNKAPTKVIQNVFDKFKKYVKALYKGFSFTDCKPSKDVEKIMDKMIYSKAVTKEDTLANFIVDKMNQRKSMRFIVEHTLKAKNNFKELSGLTPSKQRKMIMDIVKNQSKILSR